MPRNSRFAGKASLVLYARNMRVKERTGGQRPVEPALAESHHQDECSTRDSASERNSPRIWGVVVQDVLNLNPF